jgi:hypothetical protein
MSLAPAPAVHVYVPEIVRYRQPGAVEHVAASVPSETIGPPLHPGGRCQDRREACWLYAAVDDSRQQSTARFDQGIARAVLQDAAHESNLERTRFAGSGKMN